VSATVVIVPVRTRRIRWFSFLRVPETQFLLSRRGLVFVNEASERASPPNTVKSNDGL
jgi:hypothetical protein